MHGKRQGFRNITGKSKQLICYNQDKNKDFAHFLKMKKNQNSILIASAVIIFVTLISYARAITIDNDLDFGGTYRILNASTTTILGGLSVGTTTQAAPGQIISATSIKFADGTTQASASVGGVATSTTAANVSSGVFGSTIGKGNYTFQAAADTFPIFFVDATNSRIGIGTSSPAYKLDVAGGVQLGTGTEVMRTSSGNVGIGTSTPQSKFVVVGTSKITGASTFNSDVTMSGGNINMPGSGIWNSSGNVGIGTASPGSYKLAISGNVQGTAFFYSSDARLKTNIKPLQNSLQKIMQLQGVSFDWKKSGQGSVGLIAQDAQKVFPELISIDKSTGMMSLQYANLVAPLIEAVKEQQKQIEELKLEVKTLRGKIR